MTEERPSITPADDPYEFEWPDDAKEERAAERAKAAAKAAIRPAPLYLSAIVIGVGTVLAFMLPIAVVTGQFGWFIAFAGPVILCGLIVGFLPAVVLQRVTATWRRGLPELMFLLVGFLIGFGWTYFAMTLFNAPPPDKVRAATFMATAVAAAYYCARAWAETFRSFPKAVYSIAVSIGVLALASIANYVAYALR